MQQELRFIAASCLVFVVVDAYSVPLVGAAMVVEGDVLESSCGIFVMVFEDILGPKLGSGD